MLATSPHSRKEKHALLLSLKSEKQRSRVTRTRKKRRRKIGSVGVAGTRRIQWGMRPTVKTMSSASLKTNGINV
ncbi:hypothetical protein F2Q69_00018192 [Brassica cretica]|uniref:Uncharacterized protein n=1 Tax=Brassica cretica TaxID=69181 RepID=A0A8S9PU05_BRACR|nr:hypothetical protein F2Q69_00018192 [Brassica cretica]